MATIKEVAQRAGVSVTTVSRVLNKRGYISQEMHDKIYATMEELNYQPNEVARSLTRRRTKIIGLLVPSVDNPYFSEVTNQLILSAMRHGYKVMIYASDGRNDRALEYVGMLKANQVDGIIICLRSRELDALLDDNLPVVSFERIKVGRLPTVLCDNHMGGRMAAEELLASGSRRPVMIAAVHDKMLPAYDRFVGFCSVMREHGLEERIFETKENDSLHGDYSELARQALATFPDADGVFCTSDQIAASVVRCAVASGRRVPEDIRVIGFNDNYLAACLCPPLTSIRQPIPEMCEMAIECLIKQIHGEKVPVDMVFPVTLSARESTRGPRGKEEKRP